MGGLGSGRAPWRYSGTVDECLRLDVNGLVRDGAIGPHRNAEGVIAWEIGLAGNSSSVGYKTQCYAENGHLQLQYAVSSLAMESRPVDYFVDLDTTEQHFGGVRWWFICPNCDATAAKLYQPPGAEYFLCRVCHNLTYQSCRDSHKRDPVVEAIAADTGKSVNEIRRIMKQIRLAA